ncbi:2-oxoacid:ferredoxin oxidoreductase subunit beta [Pseudokineococcus sp. 1T1Z-3]|uniref:2-oxoacid:ferredoxin oxidoreductase subunit beta n=1 Tax=Pseudokineococcus sp. 1T1Z-3 TaxID=3132745 RepID=UPI00309FECDB
MTTSTPLGIPALRTGTDDVPRLPEGVTLGKKDFTAAGEVRWCPGCGDYAVLAAVQGFLPELGLRRENIVCVSGIGCSSRFPYYLDTYGMHSIHGRAPAIATGLATSRPDLSVWVVTGDGDALSIGGNHLIHAMRRNVNLTVLLFNNRIYGLTKGQYSPTSEVGKVTKSTPAGSVDAPFNPVSLALGAEATFVARTTDSDRKHLTSVLRAAAEHRGTSFVEIYQNCPIFNDGAFDVLKDRDEATARLVHLVDGEEVRYGREEDRRVVVRTAGGGVEAVPAADADGREVVVHDAGAQDPSQAFALSRLDGPSMAHVPVGVFRSVVRPTYDDLVRDQVASAQASSGPATDADLDALIAGGDTWVVR